MDPLNDKKAVSCVWEAAGLLSLRPSLEGPLALPPDQQGRNEQQDG
jgi:hypothetical protein